MNVDPTLPLVAAPVGAARIGSDVILASLFLVGPAAGPNPRSRA